MTKKDIVQITRIHRSDVNKAFIKASETMPSIKFKSAKCKRKGNKGQADFSLEEILHAIQFLRGGKGVTDLELTMIKELYTPPNFDVKKTNPWQGYIKGTETFFTNLKDTTKCCAVCEYCVTKKQGTKYKPWCNLYTMQITWKGRSPYKTFCEAFSRSKSVLLFRNNGNATVKGEKRKPVKLAGFAEDLFL